MASSAVQCPLVAPSMETAVTWLCQRCSTWTITRIASNGDQWTLPANELVSIGVFFSIESIHQAAWLLNLHQTTSQPYEHNVNMNHKLSSSVTMVSIPISHDHLPMGHPKWTTTYLWEGAVFTSTGDESIPPQTEWCFILLVNHSSEPTVTNTGEQRLIIINPFAHKPPPL